MTAEHSLTSEDTNKQPTPWLCPQVGCPAGTHDTMSGFRHGCRSGKARREEARYSKAVRAGISPPRIVENIGVTRRLKALAVIGWTTRALADKLNVPPTQVSELRRGNRGVHVRTVARIEALYAELYLTPGGNTRARSDALKKGWAGPFQWSNIDDPNETPESRARVKDYRLRGNLTEVDEVAVQRALDGRAKMGDLRDAERAAAVLRMSSWSAEAIAERLHCEERTVVRIRARLRALEAPTEAA